MTTMTPEHADRLGRLADSLDSILYSRKMPLPANFHLECFTNKIRETRDEIAAIVREATGSNPWETNPFNG